MAKLKPLSKPEEMASVPTDQPILVSLEPPPSGTEDGGPEVVKTGPEISGDDDGAKQLKDQLEALKAANEVEKTQRETAERATIAARREAAQAREQADGFRSESSDAQHDLMVGSLQSAQAELASAQSQFKAAYDAADGAAMADAQAKIGRASARVVNFEGAVAELESRKEREAQAPKQEQTREAPPDIVTQITANPNLMPKEREWLTQHQDAYGARNNELNVGYQHAMRRGLVRGTPEYFGFLDDFMGYQQRQNTDDNADDRRSTSMSAPVSRESTSMNGQRTSNQVTLTPDERELAKNMGITDVAYARQKLAMQDDKRKNPEKYFRS